MQVLYEVLSNENQRRSIITFNILHRKHIFSAVTMSGDCNSYNIYIILNFIHFFAKPFGLVRYKRHKDKYGKYVYQAARKNVWHTMHVLGKNNAVFLQFEVLRIFRDDTYDG